MAIVELIFKSRKKDWVNHEIDLNGLVAQFIKIGVQHCVTHCTFVAKCSLGKCDTFRLEEKYIVYTQVTTT